MNMTNDAKRKNFTFRIKQELSEKVSIGARNLAMSQNAYITMILEKAMEDEKRKEVS